MEKRAIFLETHLHKNVRFLLSFKKKRNHIQCLIKKL